MRLLELLELVERCININAAGLHGLAFLVVLDDGGIFGRLPRARRFPKAKDHGEDGLLPYVLDLKTFLSVPLGEGCLNTETIDE